MGAQTFTQLVIVKGSWNDAINKAREEARYENGHQSGYSGDIQTCSEGIRFVSYHPRYGTKKFWDWLDNRLDSIQKWNAEGIEITGAVATRIKHENGLKGRKGRKVFFFYGLGAC